MSVPSDRCEASTRRLGGGSINRLAWYSATVSGPAVLSVARSTVAWLREQCGEWKSRGRHVHQAERTGSGERDKRV